MNEFLAFLMFFAVGFIGGSVVFISDLFKKNGIVRFFVDLFIAIFIGGGYILVAHLFLMGEVAFWSATTTLVGAIFAYFSLRAVLIAWASVKDRLKCLRKKPR